MDISCVEMIVEFKFSTSDDPFRRLDNGGTTLKSYNSIGQITGYAAAHLGAQWRTCVYSVFILASIARIVRWDRTGAIFTGPIQYNSNPELAQFFWRYTRGDPAWRGLDPTATAPAAAELAQAIQVLGPIPRAVKLSVGQGDHYNYNNKNH
jgi:hypothetical protein